MPMPTSSKRASQASQPKKEITDDDREAAVERAKAKQPAAAKATEPGGDAELRMIPLASLVPAEDNVRSDARLDPTSPEILQMAVSIKKVGLLEPILVEPHPFEEGAYRIKAGGRRFVACGVAGVDPARCLVETVDEETRQSIFVIENTQREGLSPIELAKGLQQMVDSGLTQREVADRTGISQGHVSKLLSLLKLPAEAQEWLETGQLTQDAAQLLAALPAADQRALCSLGIPSDTAIKEVRARVEAKQRIAAAKKAAEADGYSVTEVAQTTPWAHEPMEGHDPEPVALNGTYGMLAHVDPVEHQDEECHTVIIDRNGAVMPGCAVPDNHPAAAAEDHDDDVAPIERPPRPGQMAIESLVPAMRRAVELADKATGPDLVAILSFAVPTFIRTEELYESARAAMDFLEVPDWDRNRELEELAAVAEHSPVTALLTFAMQDMAGSLSSLVDSAAGGSPLEVLEDQMPEHARDGRALLDYLRDACPDESVGTLEDVVGDFGEVEGDEEDPSDEQTATGADAPTQSSTDAEDAQPDGGAETEQVTLDLDADGGDENDGDADDSDASGITVTIVKAGKGSAPKFLRTCSACGDLKGFNTNVKDAQNRAQLEDVEGFHGGAGKVVVAA